MVAADALGTMVEAVTVAMVTGVVVVTVVAVVAVRRAARRYSRLRRLVARAVREPGSNPLLAPSWWQTQHDRHRMWRAVAAAEHLVATAAAAKVPLGDLPSLTRRLRRAAADVDLALRASSMTPRRLTSGLRAQVREVTTSATRIQGAASEALASFAHPPSAGLADAVRVEVEALRAGLAAAQLVQR